MSKIDSKPNTLRDADSITSQRHFRPNEEWIQKVNNSMEKLKVLITNTHEDKTNSNKKELLIFSLKQEIESIDKLFFSYNHGSFLLIDKKIREIIRKIESYYGNENDVAKNIVIELKRLKWRSSTSLILPNKVGQT